MLVSECNKTNKVEIQTHCEVRQVDPLEQGGFSVHTNQGRFSCESLVVATGGLSIPTLGGSGFGYELAQNLDIQFSQPVLV